LIGGIPQERSGDEQQSRKGGDPNVWLFVQGPLFLCVSAALLIGGSNIRQRRWARYCLIALGSAIAEAFFLWPWLAGWR
jgi:hypothetical protein